MTPRHQLAFNHTKARQHQLQLTASGASASVTSLLRLGVTTLAKVIGTGVNDQSALEIN